MFFAVLPGKRVKIAKGVIADVEKFLIQSAVYRNPDLKNVQMAKVPEWTIQGVVRSQKGSHPKWRCDFEK